MNNNPFQNSLNPELSTNIEPSPGAEPSQIDTLINEYNGTHQRFQEMEKIISDTIQSGLLTTEEKNYYSLLIGHAKKICQTENELTRKQLLETFQRISQKQPEEIKKELTQKTFEQTGQQKTPELDEYRRYKQPLIVTEEFSENALSQLQTFEIDPQNPNQPREKLYKIELPNGTIQYIHYVRHDLTKWDQGFGHFYRSGEKKEDAIKTLPPKTKISEVTKEDLEKIAQLEIKEIVESPTVEAFKSTPVYQEILDEILYQAQTHEKQTKEQIIEKSVENVEKSSSTKDGIRTEQKIEEKTQTIELLVDFNQKIKQLAEKPEEKVQIMPLALQDTQSSSERIHVTTLNTINTKLVEFAQKEKPETVSPLYQKYLQEKAEVETMVSFLETLAQDGLKTIETQTTPVQGLSSQQILHGQSPLIFEEEKVAVIRELNQSIQTYKHMYLTQDQNQNT